MELSTQKELAAARALDLVTPGMLLGLGTGSTADCFIDLLADRVAEGLNVRCIPSSNRTAELARSRGISLTDFSEVGTLDLAVDGTDEFDPQLNLIKGGGGALLREKIVASAACRFVVICDESKEVETLGAFPLPVEVVEFGWQQTCRRLESLGADVVQRQGQNGAPFRTAQGNLIIDCGFEAIHKPAFLERKLQEIPGVVEHGLFVAMADAVVVGEPDSARLIERHTSQRP